VVYRFQINRARDSKVRIAYQGEPGAYSEAAAEQFRPSADRLPCTSFEEVFHSVETGAAVFGVLPIENSIGGTIHGNYDLLLEHTLSIVGEIQLQIVHNLLAYPGAKTEEIRQVYSHPQGLAQCERFLRSMPDRKVVATYDTAGSAKMIRDQKLKDTAAIASERAAEVFGLSILKKSIQDFSHNLTRFLLVATSETEPIATADKTTVMFSVPNKAGALFKALSVFALRDIDLLKLESRPIRGKPWEYLFYVDLGMNCNDIMGSRALSQLTEFASSLRTLGTYPSWKELSSETKPKDS
jgi:prephenate dehydratase